MRFAAIRGRLPRLGLAARLYLGIGGAVLFTLTASLVAWLSFVALGEDQRVITEEQIPSITRSLRLAKQSALIAATVPKLLTVVSDQERREVMAGLQSQQSELLDLVDILKIDASTDTGGVLNRAAGRFLDSIDSASQALDRDLRDLGMLVGDQLILNERLQELIGRAVAAHRRLTELIVPLMDDATFFLVTGFRSLDDGAPATWTERVNEDALLRFGALSELIAEGNLLSGLLTETVSVPTVPLLQPLRERFEAAGHRFRTALGTLASLAEAERITTEFQLLVVLGEGEGGIIDLQRRTRDAQDRRAQPFAQAAESGIINLCKDIIERTATAHGLVDRSRVLAATLTDQVENVVAAVEASAAATVAESNQSIELSRRLLLLLNGVSIVGAIAMGWFYVRHSFTDPLLRVTTAAEAFERQRFEPAMLAKTAARGDELGHLSRVFLRMAEEVQARTDTLDRLVNERTSELNVKNAALEQSLKQIDDELAMAQRMQLSILPQRFPILPELSVYARMRAAREVGGDFYDVIELDERRIGIVIADVSDKGVPAALLMAVACTQIKAIAMRAGSPARVLAELNRTLSRDNDAAMFVTVFYGIVDHAAGTLVYANGGHNAPYLLRKGQPASALPAIGDVALGLVPDFAYEERTMDLRTGDTIFFFTDGITEAFNAGGDAFGELKLTDVLYKSRSLSVEALGRKVISEVELHAAGAPQSDDITCVVVHYGPTMTDSDLQKPSGDGARIRIRNDLAEIAEVTAAVEAFGARQELADGVVFNLTLVLDELLTNTITHGADAAGGHAIEVSLARAGDELTVVVEDDTKAFDPLQAAAPDLEATLEDRRIGGLGVHFVKTFMDQVDYLRVDGRNRVTMVKRIAPPGSPSGEE